MTRSLALLICFSLLFARPSFGDSPGNLTLNLKGAEIGAILGIVREASGLNVVQIDKISGTLNLNVSNKPWQAVLDEALGKVGGYKVIDGRVVKVYRVNRPQTGVVLHSRKYTAKLVDIDFEDIALANGIKIVEQYLGIELKGKEKLDLNKPISMRLMDVPADQALDVMLEIAGAGVVEDGNTFRVITFPGMAHG